MELLDVYDDNAKKTGKVIERESVNSSIGKGEHIAVAIVYI